MEPMIDLPRVDDLAAVLALESVNGFGPQKFKALWEHNLTPRDVLLDPVRLPVSGATGAKLRTAIGLLTLADRDKFRRRAEGQLEAARKARGHIVLHGSPFYPSTLWRSNNPVPVLHILGDPLRLTTDKTVACVGSRGIGERYAAAERDFVSIAVHGGWTVVSGFAMGADAVGHRAAYDAGGNTIAVMPCGLDRPFPPENRDLWRTFLEYKGAVMVSEFAWGTPAAALTLRKRNKTIVGLSRGVLVAQSSAKGGAMNAFRFALEQKKRIATFEDDGTDATSGNRQIAESDLGQVLPLTQPDESPWSRWLRTLS